MEFLIFDRIFLIFLLFSTSLILFGSGLFWKTHHFDPKVLALGLVLLGVKDPRTISDPRPNGGGN